MAPKCPPWHQACIEGLVTIVDIVSILILVGMVDVVGLVDMVSKYSRYSWQGRHSLAWDIIKPLPYHRATGVSYTAFTISKQCLLNNGFCNWQLKVVPEAHYKQIDYFLVK